MALALLVGDVSKKTGLFKGENKKDPRFPMILEDAILEKPFPGHWSERHDANAWIELSQVKCCGSQTFVGHPKMLSSQRQTQKSTTHLRRPIFLDRSACAPIKARGPWLTAFSPQHGNSRWEGPKRSWELPNFFSV